MKILLLFVLISFCLSLPALAAPSVTGVSGTISHGSQITLNGSGFGTKNPAAPLLWANFESGNISPNNIGQKTSWDGIDGFSINTTNQFSEVSKYNSVGAFGPTDWSCNFEVSQSYWSKIYQYQKRYFTAPTTTNQKFWRLWPANNAGNDFVAAWNGGVGRCLNEQEDWGGKATYQGEPTTAGMWHTEEFKWTLGTPGQDNGLWEYVRNGNQEQYRNDVNNIANNMQTLSIDNYYSDHPASGSKVYLDDIYIDNTFSHVMLGNASTYTASTHREIQIPTAWTANSITLTANQGSFTSGSQAYLYVFDSTGAVNSSGYPVTIGQENTPVCPDQICNGTETYQTCPQDCPTPPDPSPMITIGETAILSSTESNIANYLTAQAAILSQTATIQSLSFYVSNSAGKLRLGIYDATGPDGGPGQKKAETAEITPINGWNSANVTTPIALNPGTYWLAFLPSDNNLTVNYTESGSFKIYPYDYAALPNVFSTTPESMPFHCSFYATLSTGTEDDTTAPEAPKGITVK